MKVPLQYRLGDYRVVEFLGAGGMGEVYRAVHDKLGREVAIKVLSHITGKNRDRFMNEARIQAGLHHPNIATLYDFLYHEGKPCIVMEYVGGETLAERIQRVGILPITKTLHIFEAVVKAIAYLHDHRVLHRDIKSNNIKLDDSGEVKLLDFGIAKDSSSPKLTQADHCIGTPQYLSPEAIAGKPVDFRSDVWALGVLLFEMLSGRMPFEARSITDVYRKINAADFTPIRTLNPSVPGELVRILDHCLQSDPKQRYASARQLLEDYQKFRNNPRPPSGDKRVQAVFPDKTGQWLLIREYWPMLGAIMALILVMILGVFISRQSFAPNGHAPAPHRPWDTQTKQAMGWVNLDTFDGLPAKVYESGQLIGQTPFHRAYPVGTRLKLVLKRRGYRDQQIPAFNVRALGHEFNYSMERTP